MSRKSKRRTGDLPPSSNVESSSGNGGGEGEGDQGSEVVVTTSAVEKVFGEALVLKHNLKKKILIPLLFCSLTIMCLKLIKYFTSFLSCSSERKFLSMPFWTPKENYSHRWSPLFERPKNPGWKPPPNFF